MLIDIVNQFASESGILRFMPDWFELLTTAIRRDNKAVLVTVVAVGGSVPREAGATLVVSSGGQSGTIGGGNLEYTCIRDAVAMLARNDVRNCKQISLGPALGQCCGGRVEVLLDLVTDETDWFTELTDSHPSKDNNIKDSIPEDNSSQDNRPQTKNWLCRSLQSQHTFVATADDLTRRFTFEKNINDELNNTTVLLTADDNSRWICQSLLITKPAVWIYGAGHVGQAVASQLSLLECQVTLLDHRDEWQSLQPDLEINRLLSDTPAEDALSAPDDAAHVIMTHSHALDFEICHALLRRGQFGWLGLIGSDTKRQTFINRLQQRGINETAIERLRCPIGGLPLQSSRPALISLNLAAELALHWEQTGKMP